LIFDRPRTSPGRTVRLHLVAAATADDDQEVLVNPRSLGLGRRARNVVMDARNSSGVQRENVEAQQAGTGVRVPRDVGHRFGGDPVCRHLDGGR
jgi:hypothetical protein